jgi:tetratricopeptide (TPR) repeat protein
MSRRAKNNTEATFQRGIRFQQFGEIPAAIEAFKEVLAAEPNHVASLIALGQLHEKDQKVALARDYYTQATKAGPEDTVSREHLGQLEFSEGNMEAAAKVLKEYHKLGGADSKTLLVLAEVALALDDCSTVLKVTKTILDQDEKLHRAWELRGTCYARTEKFNEACICLNMAIDLHPSSIDALNAVGDVCYQGENYLRSAEFYESSLKVRSRQASIIFKYATSLWFLERWAEAVPLFEKYTEMEPDDPRGWNNLGVVLREKGDVKRSIECYKKALELDPNLRIAEENLATAMNMQVIP